VKDLVRAEIYAQMKGMQDEARRLALAAAKEDPTHQAQVRALAVLIKVGALAEAIALAESVVARDPTERLAWRALLIAAEKSGALVLAVKAATELVKLTPDDAELAKRKKRLDEELARGSRARRSA